MCVIFQTPPELMVIEIYVFRGSNEGSILYRNLDNVPAADQHLALGIFLELAFQRGSLNHVLESVLLLLRLWDRGHDNEKNSCCTTAPLIPLLRRFERLYESKYQILPLKIPHEVCCYSSFSFTAMQYFNYVKMSRAYCSPTPCFPRILTGLRLSMKMLKTSGASMSDSLQNEN